MRLSLEPGLSLQLSLSYGCSRRGVPARASFTRWALAALNSAGRRGKFELSLRVVDAAEGLALNRDFRGKPYPTNVLSFPADPPRRRGPRMLGDIALCAPVVAHEAQEQGKSVTAHYAHLLVHGVLHLLGHDHQDEATAASMEAIEIQALATLGHANPYELPTS
jgi:probable rRNA maturation factor